MDLPGFIEKLTEQKIDHETQVVLAPFTTWKIGGPADILVRLRDKTQLTKLLELAQQFNIPVTYLGGGSNVLISDQGIRGLVIKNELTGIKIDSQVQTIDPGAAVNNDQTNQPAARLVQLDTQEYYDFSKLDYDESDTRPVKVTIATGTVLAYANNYLIQNGITGLQWFAGIPGTIGGAVYNNIHGGSHFFSELVESISAIDQDGKERTILNADLGFDYDFSNLQTQNILVTEVNLQMHFGDKERAAKTSQAWAQSKREKQPFNSAGCCFKNLGEQEMNKLQLSSNSWGYVIDKVLGLKGKIVGGAQISNKHAAFIENIGNATAADVISLLDMVYAASEQKLQGITPKTEIFFLGFPKDQISKFK